MKRLRSIITRSVLHNPWNDAETEIGANEVHHDLIGEGIQSYEVRHLAALSCGHFENAAGLCSVCERPVCAQCSLMCCSCAKPIGKCHAVRWESESWRCTACSASKRRAGLLRLILSPLFRFSEDER